MPIDINKLMALLRLDAQLSEADKEAARKAKEDAARQSLYGKYGNYLGELGGGSDVTRTLMRTNIAQARGANAITGSEAEYLFGQVPEAGMMMQPDERKALLFKLASSGQNVRIPPEWQNEYDAWRNQQYGASIYDATGQQKFESGLREHIQSSPELMQAYTERQVGIPHRTDLEKRTDKLVTEFRQKGGTIEDLMQYPPSDRFLMADAMKMTKELQDYQAMQSLAGSEYMTEGERRAFQSQTTEMADILKPGNPVYNEIITNAEYDKIKDPKEQQQYVVLDKDPQGNPIRWSRLNHFGRVRLEFLKEKREKLTGELQRRDISQMPLPGGTLPSHGYVSQGNITAALQRPERQGSAAPSPEAAMPVPTQAQQPQQAARPETTTNMGEARPYTMEEAYAEIAGQVTSGKASMDEVQKMFTDPAERSAWMRVLGFNEDQMDSLERLVFEGQ